jgi:hypothetical protein
MKSICVQYKYTEPENDVTKSWLWICLKELDKKNNIFYVYQIPKRSDDELHSILRVFGLRPIL